MSLRMLQTKLNQSLVKSEIGHYFITLTICEFHMESLIQMIPFSINTPSTEASHPSHLLQVYNCMDVTRGQFHYTLKHVLPC